MNSLYTAVMRLQGDCKLWTVNCLLCMTCHNVQRVPCSGFPMFGRPVYSIFVIELPCARSLHYTLLRRLYIVQPCFPRRNLQIWNEEVQHVFASTNFDGSSIQRQVQKFASWSSWCGLICRVIHSSCGAPPHLTHSAGLVLAFAAVRGFIWLGGGIVTSWTLLHQDDEKTVTCRYSDTV